MEHHATAHVSRGVVVAVHDWAERDKFIHSSGPLGHILRQPLKIVQGVVDAWGQGEPFFFDVSKGLLNLTEDSTSFREG